MPVINSEKKAIGELLKNMREALNHYSVSELNEAILKSLNNTSEGKKQEIEATFSIVCEHFKLKKSIILRSKYKNSAARSLVYQLLHFTFKLPVRYIAFSIFSFKDHGVVWGAIKNFKNLNPSLKQDREHKEIFDKLQSDIIQLIGNDKLKMINESRYEK